MLGSWRVDSTAEENRGDRYCIQYSCEAGGHRVATAILFETEKEERVLDSLRKST